MSVFAQQQRKWWALLGVSIASFLGCVDFTIVNTALPALQADLGASVDALQWVINGFILALSSFMV
ncbi:MFS transporter, partial [Pseudomonas protegens]|nr:MFS transporter [Pseudomonas protegens]